ncbi:MAG: YkgJ family cysteine cluster protein [Caulobacter sp.]|nr:YkgJ family cysteine cluster protein [Caulobacter sp.]
MKSCGPCNLCCKVLHVESLTKPPGRWCRHTAAGAGCGIHGAHPTDCRAFACGWLQWPELGEAWRPSTAGFLIRSEPSQGRICIDVDSDRPNAWRAAAYYGTIKGWSAQVRERIGCVLVYVGAQCTVVFPEEDIDIGDLAGDDELVVGYLKGRTWRRPLVRRLLRGEIADEWRGARIEEGV